MPLAAPGSMLDLHIVIAANGKVYRNDWASGNNNCCYRRARGCGKSTIARSLARRLGSLISIGGDVSRDRAVAMRANVDLDDLHKLEQLAREARIEFEDSKVLLNGEDVTAAIRDPEFRRAHRRFRSRRACAALCETSSAV